MLSRLLNIGIATLGLLSVAGSYQVISRLPGTQSDMLAGAGVAAVGSLELHLDDGGWSPGSGIPFLIDDTAGGERGPVTRIQPECRCIVCVPLRTVERVLGMLYVGQRGPEQI